MRFVGLAAIAQLRATGSVIKGAMPPHSIWPFSGKSAYLVALGSLIVAGCTYMYPLDVGFSEGKVSFSAKNHSSGCMYDLEVKSENGDVMWHFERPLGQLNCSDDFPIIYGVLPKGAISSFPSKQLHENVKYTVEATDGDWYSGSFRIRRVLKIESDPNDGVHGHVF